MAFTNITVTGTFHHPDGSNATGTVVATPSNTMQNGVTIVDQTPVVGQITAGALSMVLVATDDTGTTPTGAYYTWVVQLDGIAPIETFTAPLSHLTSPVDFSTFTPAVISPPLSATYSLTALDARYAAIGTSTGSVDLIAAAPSGGDDSAALNALIATLPAAGGRIQLQRGSYTWNSTINLDSKSDVTIKGAGGVTAGATAATNITYTAASGAAISARSSIGIQLEDFLLSYSNAAYATHLIDFSHATASNASNFSVRRCFLGGGASHLTALSMVFLDQATSGVIEGCLFSGGLSAIRGRSTDNTHYSNAHLIQNNTFNNIVTCAIQNPGDGWSILSNTFEGLVTAGGVPAGAGSVVASTSAFAFRGMTYNGNWHGDATAAGTWVDLSVAAANGCTFAGNYFGGGTRGFNIAGTGLTGITVVGNQFDSMQNALRLALTTCRDFLVMGNSVTATVTAMVLYASGTMPNASLIQNEVNNASTTAGDLLGMVRAVNGAVSDASFPAAPPDGTMGWDSTNFQLYIRTSGAWKKSAVFT